MEKRVPTTLLVDDDERLIDIASLMLASRGVQVKAVQDLDDVVKVVREIKPDFIVVNDDLPGTSIFGALRTLRENLGRYLGILVLTQGGDKVKALALENGADECLGRPFQPVELVARICAVLRWFRLGPAEDTLEI